MTALETACFTGTTVSTPASELGDLLTRTGWLIERLEDFMAYPRGYGDGSVPSFRAALTTRAKVAVHYLVPGGKDNLLAIATRPD